MDANLGGVFRGWQERLATTWAAASQCAVR